MRFDFVYNVECACLECVLMIWYRVLFGVRYLLTNINMIMCDVWRVWRARVMCGECRESRVMCVECGESGVMCKEHV